MRFLGPPPKLRPVLVVLLVAFSAGADAQAPLAQERRVEVSDELTAVLAGGEISVLARPFEGETPSEFAERVTRDKAVSRAILLRPESAWSSSVIIPYQVLAPEARLAAIRALFPSDVRASAGWLHLAPVDVPVAAVATWFTGSPATAEELARINGVWGKVVLRGTMFRIPTEFLSPPFRDAEAVEETAPVSLEFGEDQRGKFALYRIRKGEALYSAVVVRFTGRLFADDVIQLALVIAERSGIEDVHAIPVGFPVKIPLAYVSDEYLPKEDPKAQALARERAEASQFGRPAPATGLQGIRVIVDAGHGGRDAGTIHRGVWESTYVYDVACRLRKVLLERTKAEVLMTTRDASGWETPERDRLRDSKRRLLLTDPPYLLSDPVAGVNLRWYLANSLLKRPGPDRRPLPPERTIFISLHADSLHPSVRGAMAYVPGERFLRERYGKRGTGYAAFREWREAPVVSFSKRDRVAAEGVSTRLAERLLASIREAGLPVHPFSPVRTHVIRGGREWVPAVLRYNRIPNRVLLEIANLGNDEDRKLTLNRGFRQRMAESIARGLLDFFGDRGPPTVARAGLSSRRETPARPVTAPGAQEVFGPWPELFGPWPEKVGPRLPVYGPVLPSASRKPR